MYILYSDDTKFAIIRPMRTSSNKGFTVIELIIVVVILASASILFFYQKNNIEIANRDNQRKTAINAMYYALEKSYYAQNKSYPSVINSETLTSLEPGLFTDPNGVVINESSSTYRYEPTGCNQNVCTGYTLRADLEKEADYVKTNSN